MTSTEQKNPALIYHREEFTKVCRTLHIDGDREEFNAHRFIFCLSMLTGRIKMLLPYQLLDADSVFFPRFYPETTELIQAKKCWRVSGQFGFTDIEIPEKFWNTVVSNETMRRLGADV